MSDAIERDKFDPIDGKDYLVTDSCGWEELKPEEKKKYNPYDGSRSPHAMQLVDQETGTVVHLNSGSIIKIVKARL